MILFSKNAINIFKCYETHKAIKILLSYSISCYMFKRTRTLTFWIQFTWDFSLNRMQNNRIRSNKKQEIFVFACFFYLKNTKNGEQILWHTNVFVGKFSISEHSRWIYPKLQWEMLNNLFTLTSPFRMNAQEVLFWFSSPNPFSLLWFCAGFIIVCVCCVWMSQTVK